MSKKIKAKFRCNVVHDYGSTKQVELSAVTSDSEENKTFSKYTPSGEFKITVTEETPAYNFFQPGKEYLLDITEAEA